MARKSAVTIWELFALVCIVVMLVSLFSKAANAEETEPYPETVAVAQFPHTAHWQLTMVSQAEMVDIDARGFEHITRMSCIEDGIRRIREEEAKAPDFIPQSVRWLGFICEYFRPTK